MGVSAGSVSGIAHLRAAALWIWAVIQQEAWRVTVRSGGSNVRGWSSDMLSERIGSNLQRRILMERIPCLGNKALLNYREQLRGAKCASRAMVCNTWGLVDDDLVDWGTPARGLVINLRRTWVASPLSTRQ